jgi:O-succinylbenzoic acid--CoA ligase
MDQTSQREIRAIDPTWTIADLMARLAKALGGDGPAIALSSITSSHVPSEIALVVSTSGSTANAKEVALSAGAILTSAKSTNNYLGAKPGDVWSLLLPLTHVAGVNILVRSLELGTTPLDLRKHTGKYPQVDFTAIVPTQLFRALNGDANLLEHLLSANSVLVGGAALDPQLRDQANTAGIKVVESYGMTETCGGCVYDGNPLPGTKILIADSGLIWISTGSLATTYLDSPSTWNELIADGYFKTSDIGEFRDGKLLVTGRSDDVIITGGENVSLSAIERSLQDSFAGVECAAFAIADTQWGQSLYLAIAGAVHPDESAINEYLSSQISVAAKVKRFVYVDKLPRTSLDKIDRPKLVEIALGDSK